MDQPNKRVSPAGLNQFFLPINTPTFRAQAARWVTARGDAEILVRECEELEITRFLKTLPEGSARHRDYSILLATWAATPLADKRALGITRTEVRAQLARWEEEGYAASTLNHRRRALRVMYEELYGDQEDAPNPVAGIARFTPPETEPRDVPLPLLRWLISLMPDRGRPVRGQDRSTVNE